MSRRAAGSLGWAGWLTISPHILLLIAAVPCVDCRCRCDVASAGKTTIIEALKFVTTGSLPPLSDGGKSFVHDPKMEGTALVKAQVKLSFNTAASGGEGGGGRGQSVLAIRNFQLAQKKAKREFKGMESVIQCRDENGRETSVSHKVRYSARAGEALREAAAQGRTASCTFLVLTAWTAIGHTSFA